MPKTDSNSLPTEPGGPELWLGHFLSLEVLYLDKWFLVVHEPARFWIVYKQIKWYVCLVTLYFYSNFYSCTVQPLLVIHIYGSLVFSALQCSTLRLYVPCLSILSLLDICDVFIFSDMKRSPCKRYCIVRVYECCHGLSRACTHQPVFLIVVCVHS